MRSESRSYARKRHWRPSALYFALAWIVHSAAAGAATDPGSAEKPTGDGRGTSTSTDPSRLRALSDSIPLSAQLAASPLLAPLRDILTGADSRATDSGASSIERLSLLLEHEAVPDALRTDALRAAIAAAPPQLTLDALADWSFRARDARGGHPQELNDALAYVPPHELDAIFGLPLLLWSLSESRSNEQKARLVEHLENHYWLGSRHFEPRALAWSESEPGSMGGVPPHGPGRFTRLLLGYGADHRMAPDAQPILAAQLQDLVSRYRYDDASLDLGHPQDWTVDAAKVTEEGRTLASGYWTYKKRLSPWQLEGPAPSRSQRRQDFWGTNDRCYSFEGQIWLDLPWGLVLKHRDVPVALASFAPADSNTLWVAQLQGLRAKELVRHVERRVEYFDETGVHRPPAAQVTLRFRHLLLHLAAMVARDWGMSAVLLQGAENNYWSAPARKGTKNWLPTERAKVIFDGTARHFHGTPAAGNWYLPLERIIHREPRR